jgi:hypothetical protein
MVMLCSLRCEFGFWQSERDVRLLWCGLLRLRELGSRQVLASAPLQKQSIPRATGGEHLGNWLSTRSCLVWSQREVGVPVSCDLRLGLARAPPTSEEENVSPRHS